MFFATCEIGGDRFPSRDTVEQIRQSHSPFEPSKKIKIKARDFEDDAVTDVTFKVSEAKDFKHDLLGDNDRPVRKLRIYTDGGPTSYYIENRPYPLQVDWGGGNVDTLASAHSPSVESVLTERDKTALTYCFSE